MGQTRTNLRPHDPKRNFSYKLERVSLKLYHEAVRLMKNKESQ